MKTAIALVSVLVCLGMPSAFAEQQDVERALLGGMKGDGPWWGGGIDFRAAGCANPQLCTAAQALQFNNNTGRVGVKIVDSVSDEDTHKAYLAYLKGQRYPRDNKRHYRGQQWVKWGPDGTFSWANNHVQWNNCRVANPELFTCDWKNTNNGAQSTIRFHRLPKGEPPTVWPD